jgi:hypothetical protein
MMYSSIEENQRHEVINKCYWPLLELAELGYPIGIEAPGVTLEIINDIDPIWIETLSRCIRDKKIEFIGSGYSQIIGPLVPAKVNDWNQKLGLAVYDNLLGMKPDMALINEMAYSAGVTEHYINNGYNSIIMEWNNPRSGHAEWKNEWRYHSQKTKGSSDQKIALVWADSIAFQKFQRYVHGEYSLVEYIAFLKSHVSESVRYFPLYSNDVEIFDYRPGRYHTEAEIDLQTEWKRVFDLYHHLSAQEWCEVIFPSEVLKSDDVDNGNRLLELQSAAQPIPVKKQKKYNIIRWALTGRNDLEINTHCYQIYNGLQNGKIENSDDWKKLCYLWSSDFRTHITQNRWNEYKSLLDSEVKRYDSHNILMPSIKSKINISSKEALSCYSEGKYLILENEEFRIEFNKAKGLTIKDCFFKKISESSILGTLDHGYFDDISLGNDYYSGHAIIERLGAHKITDLSPVSPTIKKTGDSIIIGSTYSTKVAIIETTYTVYSSGLKLNKRIMLTEDIGPAIIRPMTFTLKPEAWNIENLSYLTHNGGKYIEKFTLNEKSVIHNELHTGLISAHQGLGATEGKLYFEDDHKTLQLTSNMQINAMLPQIVFQRLDHKTLFLRVQYSAKEIDETDQSAKWLKDTTLDFELGLSLSETS